MYSLVKVQRNVLPNFELYFPEERESLVNMFNSIMSADTLVKFLVETGADWDFTMAQEQAELSAPLQSIHLRPS